MPINQNNNNFKPLASTYRLLKRYRRLVFLVAAGFILLSFSAKFSSTSQLTTTQKLTLDDITDPSIKRLDQILLDVHYNKLQYTEEWLRPSKKVAIISVYTGSAKELKELTFTNIQAYAKRNEYHAIDPSEDANLKNFIETTDDLMMSKFKLIRHYLDSYDWVMWCDGDSIFLNHGKSLEEAGAIDDNFDLTVAVGHSMDWHWGHVLNNGHFVVRSSEWSKKLMDDLWENRKTKCPPTVYPPLNGWLSPCGGEGSGLWNWLNDQGSLHAWLRSSIFPTDYACHVKWVNMRDINSEYPWWDDGDLIVHMPGKSNNVRKEIFGKFNERADFSTGVVSDKSGLSHDVKDWRVQAKRFDDYLGAGWNVPCRALYNDVVS